MNATTFLAALDNTINNLKHGIGDGALNPMIRYWCAAKGF
jgi:hypothetical protein